MLNNILCFSIKIRKNEGFSYEIAFPIFFEILRTAYYYAVIFFLGKIKKETYLLHRPP